MAGFTGNGVHFFLHGFSGHQVAEFNLPVDFGGGQVDITSGKFVFSASEAYLIENGRLGAPVKGATLIGNGPDVMTRVSMVGNDLRLCYRVDRSTSR